MNSTITIEFNSNKALGEFIAGLKPELNFRIYTFEPEPIISQKKIIASAETIAKVKSKRLEVKNILSKTLKPKECKKCGKTFTPIHNRTMSCDECRASKKQPASKKVKDSKSGKT